jgi:CheY-like chemotaxis protein
VRVLIVEDILENRYLLSYLLKARGWEVAEATTGDEALRLAPVYAPDLILMDVGLTEELNGYQIVGLLRAIPELAKVPVIAVTSYTMGGDREEALAAGCKGYIEKPINVLTFINQVEAILAEGQSV